MTALLLAAWAHAQEHGCDEPVLAELDLAQLLVLDLSVLSTTKTDVKVEDAAAIVTVVTRDQMRDWGYTSVGELLRHVPGFYVVDDYIVPNLAVRGVSSGLRGESSLVKVLLDGQSVAFPTTSGNWLGPELIPLSIVERIEIIRGPASALYGADAFLGVVNIVTREATSLCGVSATVGLNSVAGHLGHQEDGALGTRIGPVDLLIAARSQRTDSSGLSLPDSSPAPQVPSWVDPDSASAELLEQSRVAFARLSTDAPRLHAGVSGYLSMIDRSADLSPWLQLGTGLDPLGRTTVNHVSLAHGHVALDGVWDPSDSTSIVARGRYFRGGPTDRDRIDVGSESFAIRRRFGSSGGDASLEGHWIASEGLTLVGGADGSIDREQTPANLIVVKADSDQLAAGEVVESPAETSQTFRNAAAYLLAMWSPLDRLHLTAGGRYDHHNIYGSQASARVGLVVEPVEDWHVKLLYGSAYQAPHALLLYGVPLRPGDIIGNPDLAAQRVNTFEAVTTVRPVRRISAETSLTYSLLDDKAEFTQQGSNQVARNLARVGALSSETRLEGNLDDVVVGYLSFELNHTVRDLGQEGYQADLVSVGNPIYPRTIGHTGVRLYAPGILLRASSELSAFAARRATDTNVLENGAVYELPAYARINATLGFGPLELLRGRTTDLSFTVINLGDTRVADPGYGGIDYPIRPRTAVLELHQEL